MLCSFPSSSSWGIRKCGTTVEWRNRFFKTGRCNCVTYLEYGVACCRLEQHQHLCTESHNDDYTTWDRERWALLFCARVCLWYFYACASIPLPTKFGGDVCVCVVVNRGLLAGDEVSSRDCLFSCCSGSS